MKLIKFITFLWNVLKILNFKKKNWPFFAIWLAAWKWNLVWLDNVETPNRQKTKIETGSNIPHARCTHCTRGILTAREVYSLHARCTHCTRGILTAREVYSLWGRVEKMLFRPISEKQNSLSFNKSPNIPHAGCTHCTRGALTLR